MASSSRREVQKLENTSIPLGRSRLNSAMFGETSHHSQTIEAEQITSNKVNSDTDLGVRKRKRRPSLSPPITPESETILADDIVANSKDELSPSTSTPKPREKRKVEDFEISSLLETRFKVFKRDECEFDVELDFTVRSSKELESLSSYAKKALYSSFEVKYGDPNTVDSIFEGETIYDSNEDLQQAFKFKINARLAKRFEVYHQENDTKIVIQFDFSLKSAKKLKYLNDDARYEFFELLEQKFGRQAVNRWCEWSDIYRKSRKQELLGKRHSRNKLKLSK
jgi:hypothetical protein